MFGILTTLAIAIFVFGCCYVLMQVDRQRAVEDRESDPPLHLPRLARGMVLVLVGPDPALTYKVAKAVAATQPGQVHSIDPLGLYALTEVMTGRNITTLIVRNVTRWTPSVREKLKQMAECMTMNLEGGASCLTPQVIVTTTEAPPANRAEELGRFDVVYVTGREQWQV